MGPATEQKRATLDKRDRWRERECAGCWDNYYNWPKPRSPRGDVAVPDDYCCWHLLGARRDPKTGLAKCNISVT